MHNKEKTSKCGIMKTKVVITIDVEPSAADVFADGEANIPLLDEPVWCEVNGESQGLGFIIRTLEKHDQKATFFVEAAHLNYFPPSAMGKYVARLVDAGQDVQLHLHPLWLSFEAGRRRSAEVHTDHCGEMDVTALAKLMTEGCDQIEKWTGQRPTAIRTGNFSTEPGVFEAMRAAGLKYSSNICMAASPPHASELRLAGGSEIISEITELPVTCFADMGPVGRGRMRSFQVTALSATELISLLNQLNELEGEVAVIVTHPFEFIKKQDFRYRQLRTNRLVQKRLERLCIYLAANPERFEVVTLSEAARSVRPGIVQPELRGRPGQAFLRAAANFINDRL